VRALAEREDVETRLGTSALLSYLRHDVGLGGLETRGLKEAREEAKRLRLLLLEGDDPLEAKRATMERKRAERQERAAALAKRKTFAECAAAFLAKHSNGWKNAKHRAQWQSTLENYAFPVIGDLFVGDIDTPHIVKVLEAIWNTKRETARRTLGRIERVLNFAKRPATATATTRRSGPAISRTCCRPTARWSHIMRRCRTTQFLSSWPSCANATRPAPARWSLRS